MAPKPTVDVTIKSRDESKSGFDSAGKNADTFKITYGTHVDEGGPGPIISGNIEIK